MADLPCCWVHWLGKLSALERSHCFLFSQLVRDRCAFLIAPKPTNIKAYVLWTGPVCALTELPSRYSLFFLRSAFHSLNPPLIFPSACPLPFCTACLMCRCFTVPFLCSETCHGWSSCLKLSIIDSLLLVLNSVSSKEPNPPSHTWQFSRIKTISFKALETKMPCFCWDN